MSWLRTSPLRQSFSRNSTNRGRSIDATTECDPKACYDSFCKHWQQAYELIQRSESTRSQSHDDVMGVVNHLDHMVTLLLIEIHNCNKLSLPGQPNPPAPCLEHLLSENLLDKLYEWGTTTGRYSNAVRLEQLKLYEKLVSHSRHQLLVHEPFLRPLLKILASSQDEIFPPDVEKRLVILLNQLCVVLMQNVHLLDLFFFSTQQHGQGHGTTNFIIFSLLIPYVHREGSLGHQARDALLLCMSLSQKNSNIGTYIAQYSSMCPVLVTGLGGLYSLLPNSIEILTVDWHRITPDDVTEMSELILFMNSLEFCNAVVQVAHTLIRQQLLDFMYQGFLVPVLGPAILQTFKGSHFQTNIDSQIAAMAYLDLILRSVTEPGLMKIFIRFLLEENKFDDQRIIDVLVDRINSTDSTLCMVTLSLFDTLLNLNCEELMLEIILKNLINCQHIPISHRNKINNIDPYINGSEHFLNLTPDIMKNSISFNTNNSNNNSLTLEQQSTSLSSSPPISKTIGANWNHYSLNTNGETLYSNYHAYLFDVRNKIAQCKNSCDQWTNNYCYQKHSNINALLNNSNHERTVQMIKNFITEFDVVAPSNDVVLADKNNKQMDSLQSIGDSSGYESFKYYSRTDEDTEFSNQSSPLSAPTSVGQNNKNELNEQRTHNKISDDSWKLSSKKLETITDMDFSEDLFAQGTVNLGPFLNAIWGKLQTFTSNCLYVNLHLTGLISRLACYPLPLIHSILLRPDIPTTSDTPSFHQVLRILKQQIDAEIPTNEKSLEFIDVARSFLVDREFRLINMRRNAIEASKNTGNRNGQINSSYNQTTTSNLSAGSPVQLTPSSSYDPFKRGDSKRRSLTSSFSNIFRRPSSAGSSTSATPQTSNNSVQLRDNNSEMTSLDSSLNSLQLQQQSTVGGLAMATTTTNERTRDLSTCAVLLDEWLKELSAISQEQCIVMLAENFRH